MEIKFIFDAWLKLFAVSVLSAILGFFVAKRKKRNQPFWAGVCFVTNGIGLIILLLLPAGKR